MIENCGERRYTRRLQSIILGAHLVDVSLMLVGMPSGMIFSSRRCELVAPRWKFTIWKFTITFRRVRPTPVVYADVLVQLRRPT